MDFNKIMQQAQAMQKQLEKTTDEINKKEFEASASNGLVKVVINGEYKLVSIKIDPSILNSDDAEMIEELITIAINEAVSKVDNYKKETLGSMANAMGLPL